MKTIKASEFKTKCLSRIGQSVQAMAIRERP